MPGLRVRLAENAPTFIVGRTTGVAASKRLEFRFLSLQSVERIVGSSTRVSLTRFQSDCISNSCLPASSTKRRLIFEDARQDKSSPRGTH
jgi:hypothetical protein